jgi:hypothetical protein
VKETDDWCWVCDNIFIGTDNGRIRDQTWGRTRRRRASKHQKRGAEVIVSCLPQGHCLYGLCMPPYGGCSASEGGDTPIRGAVRTARVDACTEACAGPALSQPCAHAQGSLPAT